MFSLDAELAGDYASHRVAKYSNTLGEDNTPVIRLAEVILNRTKANYHLNNTSANQADVNLIRKRGLPTAADVTATGTALLDERRMELCYEGQRLFDLTRYKKGVSRTDCTSNICSIPYPNDRFILVIWRYETDVNPKLVQNPGY